MRASLVLFALVSLLAPAAWAAPVPPLSPSEKAAVCKAIQEDLRHDSATSSDRAQCARGGFAVKAQRSSGKTVFFVGQSKKAGPAYTCEASLIKAGSRIIGTQVTYCREVALPEARCALSAATAAILDSFDKLSPPMRAAARPELARMDLVQIYKTYPTRSEFTLLLDNAIAGAQPYTVVTRDDSCKILVLRRD